MIPMMIFEGFCEEESLAASWKVSWTNRVESGEGLQRVKEERNIYIK